MTAKRSTNSRPGPKGTGPFDSGVIRMADLTPAQRRLVVALIEVAKAPHA